METIHKNSDLLKVKLPVGIWASQACWCPDTQDEVKMSFSEYKGAQGNTHFQAFCSHRGKFARLWWRTLWRRANSSQGGRSCLLQESCRQQLLIHSCWICPGGLPCIRVWGIMAAGWRSPATSQRRKVGLLSRLLPDNPHPRSLPLKKGTEISLQPEFRLPRVRGSKDGGRSWRRDRNEARKLSLMQSKSEVGSRRA